MSLEAADNFFSLHGKIQEISILLDEFQLAEQVTHDLNLLSVGKEWKAESWQEIEKEFYHSMIADQQGNQVSNGIIVFLVSMGVLNTVLMLVLERTREYGILKAIGTRPKVIFQLILFECGILSLLSICVGMLIALPLNYWF